MTNDSIIARASPHDGNRRLVAARRAVAEDLVAVVDGGESVARDDHVLEALDGLLLEFDHLPAVNAVEVVVVGAAAHGFVDAPSAVEVVAVDEPRLADDGERPVDGGRGAGRPALAWE